MKEWKKRKAERGWERGEGKDLEQDGDFIGKRGREGSGARRRFYSVALQVDVKKEGEYGIRSDGREKRRREAVSVCV